MLEKKSLIYYAGLLTCLINDKLPFSCYRYYAAPEDENNAHAYNTTNTGYEEPTGEIFGHYSEILENFEGTNSSMADTHQYEEVHHYIEIQP